jgi:hypothetical protein
MPDHETRRHTRTSTEAIRQAFEGKVASTEIKSFVGNTD